MAQRAMLQCMYVNGIVICDVFDVVIWAVALQLLISPSLKARYHGLAIDRTYYSTLVVQPLSVQPIWPPETFQPIFEISTTNVVFFVHQALFHSRGVRRSISMSS